ncbi:hypothetical protein Barb6XT_02355 [Bacteroidales bacterium Barb6XT]|nr:hypothetical protein Barb6XT_02355 [Bacteroidales bacterium Barb6XT]
MPLKVGDKESIRFYFLYHLINLFFHFSNSTFYIFSLDTFFIAGQFVFTVYSIMIYHGSNERFIFSEQNGFYGIFEMFDRIKTVSPSAHCNHYG